MLLLLLFVGSAVYLLLTANFMVHVFWHFLVSRWLGVMEPFYGVSYPFLSDK